MTRSTLSRRARNSASVMIVRRRPASRPSRRRCFLASRRVEPLTAVGSSRCERGSRTRVDGAGRVLALAVAGAGTAAAAATAAARAALAVVTLRRRDRCPRPRRRVVGSVSDAVPAWSSSAWLRPRRPRPPRRRRLREPPSPSSVRVVGPRSPSASPAPRRVVGGVAAASGRVGGLGAAPRPERPPRLRRPPRPRGPARPRWPRRRLVGGLGAGSSSATRSAGAWAGAVARRRRGATGSGAWKSRPKLGTAARRPPRPPRLVLGLAASSTSATSSSSARRRPRRLGSPAGGLGRPRPGGLAGRRSRPAPCVGLVLRGRPSWRPACAVAFLAGLRAPRRRGLGAGVGSRRDLGGGRRRRRRRHRHPARRRARRPSWSRGGAWASRWAPTSADVRPRGRRPRCCRGWSGRSRKP